MLKGKLTEAQIAQAWRFLRISLLATLPLLVKEQIITGKWATYAAIITAALAGGTEVAYRALRPVMNVAKVDNEAILAAKETHPSSWKAPEGPVSSLPFLPDSFPVLPEFWDNQNQGWEHYGKQ